MARGRFGGGEGVYDNPYLVEDSYDLHAIRLFPTKCFKLVYDINLGHSPFTDGQGWIPIPKFSGELNGNGKTIHNLYINRPSESNIGLFAEYGDKGSVHDISFKNVNITGGNFTGTIFGRTVSNSAPHANFTDLAIYNVSLNGRIKAYGNNAGAVTGQLMWDNEVTAHTADASRITYVWTAMQNIFSDMYIEAQEGVINVSGMFGSIDRDTIPNSYIGDRVFYTNVGISNIINNGSFTRVGNVNGRANPIYTPVGATHTTSKINFFVNIDTWRKNVTVSTDGQGKVTTTETTYPDNPTELDKDQMKDYSNFGTLKDAITSTGKKIWRFDSSRMTYPRFYFAGSDLAFIQLDDGFLYVYENGNWVKKFESNPDIDDAERYAMHSLEDIPKEAWAKLKTLSVSPKLINIAKKQSTYYTGSKVLKASEMTNFNTSTKKIYKRSVNFFEFSDGIFNIQTTK